MNDMQIIDNILDSVDKDTIEQLRMAMIIIFVNSLKEYVKCYTKDDLLFLKKNNNEYYKESFRVVLEMMPPLIFDTVIDLLDDKREML